MFDQNGLVTNDVEHKGALEKVGTVVDVCYSSVYPVSGKKTPVFKLQVLIPEWEDEPERCVWYVHCKKRLNPDGDNLNLSGYSTV